MKETIEKPAALYDTFERKPGTEPKATHYCPGCGHGNLHKFIAEALDDFGVRERTIFVSPVGCSVFGYYYFNCGNIQAAHGRAPAVATAVKRAHPHSIVICYQGDGDLASIGGNNIIQAANRGENFTVIFVNNALYGMTGGQMAPTTLIGQKTTTTPEGRNADTEGYPMHMSEMLGTLQAPVYIERCILDESKHVMKTRAAIRRAIQVQIDNKGFSMVEAVSPCPTGWGVDPKTSRQWITDELAPVFPAKVVRDRRRSAEPRVVTKVDPQSIDYKIALNLNSTGSQVQSGPIPQGKHRMVIAGFGGQGVLSMGMFVSRMAMNQGRYVSWLPSYGPEMRGGTANCHVMLSDQPIGSPLIAEPTMAIALNQPSLEKFGPLVAPGGIVLYDSSFSTTPWTRDDVTVHAIPLSNIANELGSSKVMNMVALGAMNALLDVFPTELIHDQINALGKPKLAEINRSALAAGAAAVLAHSDGGT